MYVWVRFAAHLRVKNRSPYIQHLLLLKFQYWIALHHDKKMWKNSNDYEFIIDLTPLCARKGRATGYGCLRWVHGETAELMVPRDEIRAKENGWCQCIEKTFLLPHFKCHWMHQNLGCLETIFWHFFPFFFPIFEKKDSTNQKYFGLALNVFFMNYLVHKKLH